MPKINRQTEPPDEPKKNGFTPEQLEEIQRAINAFNNPVPQPDEEPRHERTYLEFVLDEEVGTRYKSGRYGQGYYPCIVCGARECKFYTYPQKWDADKNRYHHERARCWKCDFRGDVDDILAILYPNEAFAKRVERREAHRAKWERTPLISPGYGAEPLKTTAPSIDGVILGAMFMGLKTGMISGILFSGSETTCEDRRMPDDATKNIAILPDWSDWNCWKRDVDNDLVCELALVTIQLYLHEDHFHWAYSCPDRPEQSRHSQQGFESEAQALCDLDRKFELSAVWPWVNEEDLRIYPEGFDEDWQAYLASKSATERARILAIGRY